MALQTEKSITLTGKSMVGREQAIFLSANVRRESVGNTSVTQSITNQELYSQNLRECRKDVTAFQDLVWEVEDQILAEAEAEEITE